MDQNAVKPSEKSAHRAAQADAVDNLVMGMSELAVDVTPPSQPAKISPYLAAARAGAAKVIETPSPTTVLPQDVSIAQNVKVRSDPAAAAVPQKKKKTPSRWQTSAVIDDIEHPSVMKFFRAAGVIFLHRTAVNGTIHALLCEEVRELFMGANMHLLGGRRDEDKETPLDVAAREFWEETCKLVPLETIRARLQQPDVVPVMIRAGKYVVFIVPTTPEELLDLPQRHDVLKRKHEVSKLHWCPWSRVSTHGPLPKEESGFLHQIIEDLVNLQVVANLEKQGML